MASNAAARNDACTEPSTCLIVVGQVGAVIGIPAVEAVGQEIVFRDDVLGNAERMQDQRAGKTGAVLAGGAVDHQRRAIFQQMRKQRAEMLRVVLHIAAVGAAHHLDGVVRRQRRAGGRDGAQRRDDRGFDRQRMDW